jgi:hypothetical protein
MNIHSVYSIPTPFIGSLAQIENWEAWLTHISSMRFDAVHLTPFCQRGEQIAPSGKYGCFYSIKDHRAFDPSIAGGLSEQEATQAMQHVTTFAKSLGVQPVFDLVLNHTSTDHPWITENPSLYQTNALIVDGDAWDDVRPLNWSEANIPLLVADAIQTIEWAKTLGFTAIRADYPHNIPHHAWEKIINTFPDMTFIGETVGCGHQGIRDLSEPFHSLYSSHYFSEAGLEPWLLDERNLLLRRGKRIIAPVSTHDELPLATKILEQNNTLPAESIIDAHKQRYWAASNFGIPFALAGFEFCTKERANILNHPAEGRYINNPRTPDQMLINPQYDLRKYIASINFSLQNNPLLKSPLLIDSKPLGDSGGFIQWRWNEDGTTLVTVHNIANGQLPDDVLKTACEQSGHPENFVPIAEQHPDIPTHAIFYHGNRPDWLDQLVEITR